MLGRGHVKLTLPDGRATGWKANQRQNGYAEILARLFGDGDTRYLPNYVYVEFENVASPGDPVSIPSYDKTEGIEYYSALSGSGTRDFLRVPITSKLKTLADGFDGATFNEVTYTALTTGSTGVHGKTFSSGANSKICGVALVSAPVVGDRSQDLVWGRMYYETADQLVKPSSGQITVTYLEGFDES